MKIETNKDGSIDVHGDFLPYLVLLKDEQGFKSFAGWHSHLDMPTFPCFGLEIEYRCDSSFFYFTLEDLEDMIKLLKDKPWLK